MNNLLLSLAMAALGQFGGLGGAPVGLGGAFPRGPSPFGGNGLAGGVGMIPGAGFGGGGLSTLLGNGLGGMGGGLTGGDGVGSNRSRSLKLATLGAAQCLYENGRISGSQARQFIAEQGRRQGWAQGWEAVIQPQRVARTVRDSGGCNNLLSNLHRYGRPQLGSMAPGGSTARIPVIGYPGARGMATPGPGHPTISEAEGFGLAPYR